MKSIPTREDWKEVARQGVTAVYVQPSHSSLLGGRARCCASVPRKRLKML